MDNEEMPRQRDMGRITKTAFPALIGGAVRFVLGNMFVELKQVLGCEATDGAFVNFKNIDFQLLQRLGDGPSRGPEFQHGLL